ncbi:MAG: hypothetical protein ACYDBB_05000 [Armatimonadota bacterium]
MLQRGMKILQWCLFIMIACLFMVVIPTREAETAGKAARGIHPIVDLQENQLFGGMVNGQWVIAEKMIRHVKGGEKYHLYTSTRCVGEAVGTKATPAEPCDIGPEITIQLSEKLAKQFEKEDCLIGIHGEWNALPRIPKFESIQQKVYQEAVREQLDKLKLPDAKVNITRLIRIDIEGDGTDEVLVCATTPGKEFFGPDVLKKDEYSIIFLRKLMKGKVETIPVAGERYLKDCNKWMPNVYTLKGVMDVNGDGIMELIIGWRYYEGSGNDIFQMTGTKVKLVFSDGNAV